MYYLERQQNPHIIQILFDNWDYCDDIDPFFVVVRAYSEEHDLRIKVVDLLYQYKFADDEYDLRFLWSATFRIIIYVPASRNYAAVYESMKKICRRLNRDINEKKRRDSWR